MTARLTQITPFVPCTSLAKQLEFYCGVLGFSAGYQDDEYAFVHRDDVALRLLQVWDNVDLSHPERQTSFYVDAKGIDDLYAAMKPKLDALPEGRVRAPFNQDYGQREFHIKDEDCTLVFFGETI